MFERLLRFGGQVSISQPSIKTLQGQDCTKAWGYVQITPSAIILCLPCVARRVTDPSKADPA